MEGVRVTFLGGPADLTTMMMPEPPPRDFRVPVFERPNAWHSTPTPYPQVQLAEYEIRPVPSVRDRDGRTWVAVFLRYDPDWAAEIERLRGEVERLRAIVSVAVSEE